MADWTVQVYQEQSREDKISEVVQLLNEYTKINDVNSLYIRTYIYILYIIK